MGNAIVKQETDVQFSAVEQVVIMGDLAKLSPDQRVQYYNRVCESVGLNPYTRPFAYIALNGKLVLYALKDATEQLRKIHGISITRLDGQVIDDLYIVNAVAVARDGRSDMATGAVTIGSLKGESKANAIMKAETKAKRRVTLSIAGLGWADESEVDSIPNAQRVTVDVKTGEIIEAPKQIEQKQPEPDIVTTEPPVISQDGPVDGKPEMSPARKRFHAEGVTTFGKEWEAARHWLVDRYTKKATPGNVRKSSGLLSDDECDVLADTLVNSRRSCREEYAKSLQSATVGK